jgi:catechol 2,3-dioxygenase-like lactoylglutathione lyase family enzyme
MSMEPPTAEPPPHRVHRIKHLCLRVRDVRRSLEFYCRVLGFRERIAGAAARAEHVCELIGPDGAAGLELVLTQGLPPGEYLVGLDHLAFDTDSAASVDAVYQRAVTASFQATPPRLQHGRWRTYLFDPDGYKLEVSALAREAAAGA